MAREWRKVSAEEARAHALYGVKNWLAVFALGVLLVPLREFSSLDAEASRLGIAVGQLLDTNASFKVWATLVLTTEIAVVMVIYGLMLSKSPHFRIATSAILIALFPTLATFAFLTGAPGSDVGIVFGFFAWIISCLVWVTYLQRSQRVRVTFEHCVLSADVRSSAPLGAEPDARCSDTALPLPAASELQAQDSPAMPTEATSVSLVAGERTIVGTTVEAEEAMWAQALNEFSGADRKQGLWAKSFAEAFGNDSAAQARYLSERVRQLSEERAADSHAKAERVAERRRNEDRARQKVADRASVLRTDFVLGKRLSPADVALLVEAVEVDPSLLMLTDRVRGETLLHWSARHGLRAETATLVSKGANAGAPNGDGKKPHELTEDRELKGILRSAENGARLA